ncbi:PP2C family protein-serine/threonine phosphatase [Streptomyces abyssomicinicus]|uniref:PP2C family protein-serine/threonine phosphatase n=1 Tax=Streptomyces abyssomicinicus TaxID=574929 RepID=UPI0013DF5330|nr:PP2C family protein-serine/threonine phosphatase [Streptomyces abyssomicinicus]
MSRSSATGSSITKIGGSDGAQGPLLLRLARWGWLVPGLFLIAVVVLGVWAWPSPDADNWLLMAPLLAAALCSVRVTALFGCAVLLVNRLVPVALSDPGPRLNGFLLDLCVGILAVLVAVLRSRTRTYMTHLQNALLTARQVVVRPIPPGWGGVESATAYLPADTESRMGGDFYDILTTPHGTRLVLGDVQGKGLAALSTAGAVVGAFREAGYNEADPAVIAARMDNSLRRHNTLMAANDRGHEPRFVTAVVIAFLEDGTHADVINFGHEGPLVFGREGVRQLPQERNPPLGLIALTGARTRIDRVRLEREETVLLVTDGITEARDKQGDFFPLSAWADQLARTSADDAPPPPHVLLNRLVKALTAHTSGRLDDDATLVAVRRPTRNRGVTD